MAPTLKWSSLRSLGEMRLLQVSYALLVAIPLAATGIDLWNKRIAEEYIATIDELSSRITDEIGASSAVGAEAASGWIEWLQREQRYPVHQAMQRWPELLESIRMEAGDDARLQQLIDEAIATLEGRAKVLPMLELSVGLRLLFAAAVLISVANFLYAAWCPEVLRVVHRPDRLRSPLGLGDSFDCLYAILRTAKSSDKDVQRLLSDYVAGYPDWSPPPQGTFDPRVWALHVWEFYQTRAAPARLICWLCYTAGLALVLVVLAIKMRLVFVVS